MKIGIITFHRSHNYGALLQGYALKSYLTNIGYNTDFVDYWPLYHQKQYKFGPKISKRSSLLSKIKAYSLFFLTAGKIKNRKLGFESFMREHLSLGSVPGLTKNEELKSLDYNLIFFGSDQIWRYFDFDTFKGYNEVYYGKYPQNGVLKVSYAASMGSIAHIAENKSFLKENLTNFDMISVREDNLKTELQSLSSKPITKVLDPVFLLDKNEWLSLLKPQKIGNSKYLLFYNLILDEKTTEYVERIAKEKNLEIIELRSRVFPFLKGDRYNFSGSPIDFISLIYYSDFVVSSSFHGIAFSIIFQKEFIATGMGKKAERVTSLLTSLSIQDRYVDLSLSSELPVKVIDHTKVEGLLDEMKNNSKKFIADAIKLVE